MALPKPAAIAFALALTFALSACGSSQTVEEACEYVNTEIKAPSEEMSGVDSTDAKAAEKAIKTFTKELGGIEDGIKNKEVKDAFGALVDVYEDLAESYKDFAASIEGEDTADVDTEKITEIGTNMQEASQKYADLCGDIS